jgi:hypothetical protein
LGLGYRWQSQHIGTDTSLWLTGHPEGAIITKLDFLCHYIPCPNHASQWYLGAGVGIGSFWVLAFGALVGVIPEVAVGYQYQTSKGGPRFVQLQAATLVWDSGRGWAADLQGGAHLTLSYGFGF